MLGTVYTDEMIDWLRENAPGHFWQETADKFYKKFGIRKRPKTLQQVGARRNILSGLDRFPKGHEPWNKGQKGWSAKGTEKTRFVKGQMPHNYRPVGSERVDNEDGYTMVKVADPRTWRLKHVLIWENYYHEKVNTRKECIIFLDGNRSNFDISNLKKIPRNISVRMSKLGLWNKNKELTETGLNIAKIAQKIGELKHAKH